LFLFGELQAAYQPGFTIFLGHNVFLTSCARQAKQGAQAGKFVAALHKVDSLLKRVAIPVETPVRNKKGEKPWVQ
jgi:hypothetical protein